MDEEARKLSAQPFEEKRVMLQSHQDLVLLTCMVNPDSKLLKILQKTFLGHKKILDAILLQSCCRVQSQSELQRKLIEQVFKNPLDRNQASDAALS